MNDLNSKFAPKNNTFNLSLQDFYNIDVEINKTTSKDVLNLFNGLEKRK